MLFDKIQELRKQGLPFVLCTVVEKDGSLSSRLGMKMLVLPNNEFLGSVGGGINEYKVTERAKTCFETRKSELFYVPQTHPNDRLGVFIEFFPEPARLLIFGAGHIGVALAGFAANLGFSIQLFDSRKEVVESARIPGEANINRCNYYTIWKDVSVNRNDFVVICTHEHNSDFALVEAFITTKARYLGMVGSKNKTSRLKQHLIDKGIGQEIIDRLDAPAGVPIRAKTADEIAVSILARLVDEKNNEQ